MNFAQSGKLKAVTFSYDDGITQDVQLVELLNQYGLKCTFNINSGQFGRSLIIKRQGQRISHYRLQESEIKALYEGHEIAAHCLTHPHLTQLEDAEVIRQVEQDRLTLSEIAGYEVVGMAYPYGDFDHRVVDLIQNHTGIKYSRTVRTTRDFAPENDLLRWNTTIFHLNFDELMDLGRKFVELETDTPQVFSIWGHSYEMDSASENWMRLEKFFRLISNREDIFYGTNKEVLL